MQIPHVLRRHARRSNVGELNEFQRSNLAEAGNGGSKIFTGTSGHQPVFFRVVLHGDRAAGGYNDNFFINHFQCSLRDKVEKS